MTYSVWSPSTKMYTYYETSQGFEDEPPRPSGGSHRLGLAPGQLGYRLPVGARMVGTGKKAKGVVVHPAPAGGLGLGFFEAETGGIMLLVGAYFLWTKVLKKHGHKKVW